jgi:peroxiredoxin
MRLSALAALAALALPALAEKPAPELRKAPEFEIVEASGKKSLLSQYRGKVCVLEFIFTTCPHCQVTSRMYQGIYNDYKAKGFQMLAVAFNEPLNAQMAAQFSQQFGITFPVGMGQREPVMNFLGIPMMSVDWVVPQIVVIDKKGMIRMQSDKKVATKEIQDEAYMRNFIDSLLKEGTTAATPPKKGVAPVKKAS